MNFTYKVKPTLCDNGESFFGPGGYTLLKEVEKTNSLQSACRSMNMAYSKGWRLLKNAEKQFGKQLLVTKSGGAHGGCSELTPFAKAVCREYESFCAKINTAAESSFKVLKGNLENEAN